MNKKILAFLSLISIMGFKTYAATYTYLSPVGRLVGPTITAKAQQKIYPNDVNAILAYVKRTPTITMNIGSGRDVRMISGFPDKVGLLWNNTNAAFAICDVGSDGAAIESSCTSEISSIYHITNYNDYLLPRVNFPPGLKTGDTYTLTPFFEWTVAKNMTIETDDNPGEKSVDVIMTLTDMNTRARSPCGITCASNTVSGGALGGGEIVAPPLVPVQASLSITGPTSLNCSAILPSSCVVTGDFSIITAVPARFSVQNDSDKCGENPVSVQAKSGGQEISVGFSDGYKTKSASTEKIQLEYVIKPTQNTLPGEVCQVASTLILTTD
ncbi:hypothetical protein [Citrobacter meridianamericanus]|uniref:hypothetical protein n=1 Tax=Citrobacter meridianamericanus TaxID=2894201 RepID=UPI0039C19D7C